MSKQKSSPEKRRLPEQFCFCGSGQIYLQCCGRFIEAGQFAPTAEQLMRSRYSAYVLQRADYLSRTWHASTRPAKLEIDNAQWLGLNVVRTQAGAATDLAGIVEFVARYKLNGKAGRVHETSRFIKQDRQWFYVDAITVTEKPAACL